MSVGREFNESIVSKSFEAYYIKSELLLTLDYIMEMVEGTWWSMWIINDWMQVLQVQIALKVAVLVALKWCRNEVT